VIDAATISHAAFPKEPIRFSGGEYRACCFDNCSLAAAGPAGAYSYIGQCVLIRSRQLACGLSGVVLDEVLVDGLARLGRMPLFLSAVVFRHVTLRGRISMFKLNPTPQPLPTPGQRESWIGAHLEFYRNVDWALDISRADFTFGPDLHYVPGQLIRRDEETQALVERDALQNALWQSLPWGGSALRVAVDWFLQDGPYQSTVLVAGRKTKSFRQDLDALEMLRREGLAL